LRLTESMAQAMRSRSSIDQAIGILMTDGGRTPDEAFRLLVQASQRETASSAISRPASSAGWPSARHRDNRTGQASLAPGRSPSRSFPGSRSFLDREHPGQLQQSEEPAYRRAGLAQHQPAVGISYLFGRMDEDSDPHCVDEPDSAEVNDQVGPAGIQHVVDSATQNWAGGDVELP
jgi:ANTAR domain